MSNNDILTSPLFAGISQNSLLLITAISSQKIYEDGSMIMVEKDPETPIFIIMDGDVRVFRTNMDGREQTLAILKKGEIFNLPAAFSSDHRSPASAVSLGISKIMQISQNDFRTLVYQVPEISQVIIYDLSNKLIHLTNLVHDVSLRSVRGRLAKFLLIQSEKSEKPTRNWTQEQIATQLATRREVLSRSLRDLIKDGLIKTDRQNIIILDYERLKEEAGI